MAQEQPAVIALQVEKVAQLFDTLDPLPFRERDLDRDAEEFIVDWARELPARKPIVVQVHLPKAEAESEHGRDISHAIQSYFAYRADVVSNELKELFRFGRYALLIGLVVLAACIALGQLAASAIPSPEAGRFLSEGLIILGWVANWQPIEIFLYEWWRPTRRRNLYRRLAKAEIVLKPR